MLNILLVDDSEEMRKIVTSFIPSVPIVTSSHAALSKIQEQPVWDLVAYDSSLVPELTAWIVSHAAQVKAVLLYGFAVKKAALKKVGYEERSSQRVVSGRRVFTLAFLDKNNGVLFM